MIERGDTMRCDDLQQCLIDETLPRTDGFDAHLLSCDECRAFSRSLGVARSLRGEELVQTRRVPVAKARRRLQIGAAFALIAGGVVVEARLAHDALAKRTASPAVISLSPENRSIPVEVSPEDEAAAWRALGVLARGAAADAQRNPRVNDDSYQSFGALARWVAPNRTYPIRSLHLGKAETRIISTSED